MKSGDGMIETAAGKISIGAGKTDFASGAQMHLHGGDINNVKGTAGEILMSSGKPNRFK